MMTRHLQAFYYRTCRYALTRSELAVLQPAAALYEKLSQANCNSKLPRLQYIQVPVSTFSVHLGYEPVLVASTKLCQVTTDYRTEVRKEGSDTADSNCDSCRAEPAARHAASTGHVPPAHIKPHTWGQMHMCRGCAIQVTTTSGKRSHKLLPQLGDNQLHQRDTMAHPGCISIRCWKGSNRLLDGTYQAYAFLEVSAWPSNLYRPPLL